MVAGVTPGARVVFSVDKPVGETPPPVTVPPTVPVSAGAVANRTSPVAVWAMMWPNSPRFDWAAIPDCVDIVWLAFLKPDGRGLHGYGPWGKTGLQEGMRRFLAARPGRVIGWSIGGGGYEVQIGDPARYVANILDTEKDLFTVPGESEPFARFMGGNIDWESEKIVPVGDKVAAVLRSFKESRPGFWCAWTPNGTVKEEYAALCARHPDVVDVLEFQCYDISGFTFQRALDEVYEPYFFPAFDRSRLGAAMMIEAGRNDRWTMEQCVDAARRFRALGVTKTSFWEAGAREFGAWAEAMRTVNP